MYSLKVSQNYLSSPFLYNHHLSIIALSIIISAQFGLADSLRALVCASRGKRDIVCAGTQSVAGIIGAKILVTICPVFPYIIKKLFFTPPMGYFRNLFYGVKQDYYRLYSCKRRRF